MSKIQLLVAPGEGAGGLLFGMTEGQARPIMAAWGEIVDATAPGGALTLRTEGVDPAFSVYACFRPTDGRLVSIEIWRPETADEAEVSIDGVGIFGQPAEEVLRSLASRGFEVEQSDPFSPLIESGYIAFDRDGGDDRDDDGVSRFIEYILLAPPDYPSRNMNVAVPEL